MDPQRLMNGVLREYPRGRDIAEILAAALASVEPRAAVRAQLARNDREVLVRDKRYTIAPKGRVFVVGGGKAGAPMTEAVIEILGDLVASGVVIVKEGHVSRDSSTIDSLGPIKLFEAAHPVPDARAVMAATQLISVLEQAEADDLVVVLVSGGGSAVLTIPDGELSLEDVRATTDLLLRCGATINEINSLRKHCTRLGGGQLAQLAWPARIVSLIISDVVGSPLDVIASGPTAPDKTTFVDAWQVVERYDLIAHLPSRVTEHLRKGLAGEIAETPKPGEELWSRVDNRIIADNGVAADAAVSAARQHGYNAEVITLSLEGEAREVGRVVAGIARTMEKRARTEGPLLSVMGGETTVTVVGSGRGGRNQELALGAVEELAGTENVLLATLATDGDDGPTDAAGAIVTGKTLVKARNLGYDAADFLRRNDAYSFFAPLDALLKTGPTLTNVNDLLLIAAGV